MTGMLSVRAPVGRGSVAAAARRVPGELLLVVFTFFVASGGAVHLAFQDAGAKRPCGLAALLLRSPAP